MSKRLRAALLTAAVSVSVVFAAVLLIQTAENSKPENKGVVVYRKGAETVVRLGGKETVVSDAGASEFKYDEETKRLFYVSDSACSDGLYDLYYAEKRGGELVEPHIVDYGVEKAFDVVDGKAYYLKKNFEEGADDGCVCDVARNEIEIFSDNVAGIYPLKGSASLYFTRLHRDSAALYKYCGGSPVEICRNATRAAVYNGSENPRLFYEKESLLKEGATELYVVCGDREPELICDDVFFVMYDEYKPSGNLYYFAPSDESVAWSYVIADRYERGDREIIPPQKNEFLSFFGVSFGYNEALKEYKDKLTRDEIRAALNETAKKGDFSARRFSVFAYNDEGTFRIAENVDPENVCAVSAFGRPEMIFKKFKVEPSETNMSSLVSAAQRSSMNEVVDYARSVLKDSVRAVGTEFAAYGDKGAVSRELGGYDDEKTLFSFSRDGKRIYAFVRDREGERLNLYTNDVGTDLKPSERKMVDAGISSYRFIGDSVLYLKTDVGKNVGDVYSFDGIRSVKLSNAANAFTVGNPEDVIILKKHNVQATPPTADYYICLESGEKFVESGVIVSSFNYADPGRAAYIVGDGGLCVFAKGRSARIDDSASEILLFQ